MHRERVLAALAGALAGAPTAGIAWQLLPSQVGRHSLIPWLLGGLVGWMAAVLVWSDGRPDRRSTRLHTAVATAVAIGGMVGFVAIDPRATRHFDLWVPWLSAAGVAVWVAAAIDERWRKQRRALWTALIVGLALASAGLHSEAITKVALGQRARAWNLYHYQVGSKYFGELGYTELYAATLAADDDWQQHKAAQPATTRRELDEIPDLRHVTRVRDMRTYHRVDRKQAVEGFDRSILTPERLQELGADVRGLARWLPRDTWKEVLTDLGYNPAPPWTLVGTPVSSVLATSGVGLWLVANSDLPVFVVLVGFLLWAFGLRTTAVGVLFLLTVPFNEDRLTGGLLQYDWLASMGIALALWHRGWYAAAGAVLSWGAMTRVFPGFLVFPALATLAWHAVRRREIPPNTLRFAATFTAACLVLAIASHATGRGASTWPEWVSKIRIHSKMHVLTSDRRLGLKRLTTHDPKPELPFDYHHDTVDGMLERVAVRSPYYQALALLFLLPALWRRKPLEAMVLMLYLVFIGTVTSRYYASAWMLLPLLARPDDDDGTQGLPGVIGTVGILGLPGVMHLCPDDRVGYYVANYYVWAMFAAICVAYAISPSSAGTEAEPGKTS